jgi:hypothetical protein
MVLTTTTDATLDQFGLVLLEDDKKLQNADKVLPVVNAKDAGSSDIADTSQSSPGCSPPPISHPSTSRSTRSV